MKKFFRLPLLLAAVLCLALCAACGRGASPDAGEIQRADSLMNAAYQVYDYDRLLSLADELQAAGSLSPIKANYWRGYAHSRLHRSAMAISSWEAAVSASQVDEGDLLYYAGSGNRLSDALLLRGEYERALRVALPVIARIRETGIESGSDYAHLLITVGCCELYLGHLDEARALFAEADGQFRQLLEHDGNNLRNHTSAIAGAITVTENCLSLHFYEDGYACSERMHELIEGCRALPGATGDYVDRQVARWLIYRAWALDGLGRRQEAEAAYNEMLATDYAATDEGKLEAADYLMQAGRWAEAADNYKVLDAQIAKYNIQMTLNNIPKYLLPKLQANGAAGRADSANVIGRRICFLLDSAIAWNRQERAAEIEEIYGKQQIELEMARQHAAAQRVLIIATFEIFGLILAAALLIIIFRYRAARRLKEANRKLAKANARAEESSRMKTVFIQQISHEIRTPLNMLTGFAQILTTPGMELDDDTRSQINTSIVDNTNRITGLINKILSLSEIVSSAEMELRSESACEIAVRAADESGIRNDRQIAFELEIPDGPEGADLVVTNERAVVRILDLLLDNARKYTREGTVRMQVVPEHECVKFVVEDTGIGIPPEEAERVFEAFVQLDDYNEGTGLGLPVARSIAGRLGGSLILDTDYSTGARFVLTLPKEV